MPITKETAFVDINKDPNRLIHDLEQKLSVRQFEELKTLFEEELAQQKDGLSVDKFKKLFRQCFKAQVSDRCIEALFKKVDPNATNNVTWDDFSTYILMKNINSSEKNLLLEEQSEDFEDGDEDKDKNSAKKEVIKVIEFVGKEGKFVSITKDGLMCTWSSDRKLVHSMNCRDFFVSSKCWVMSAVCLHDQAKIAISCDDGRLYIYELFQIKTRLLVIIGPLESVPLSMCYYPKYEDQRDLFVWGDEAGNANIMTINRRFFVEYVSEEKPAMLSMNILTRKEQMEKFGLSYECRYIHREWVTCIKYLPDFESLLTTSMDTKKSLAVTNMKSHQERSLHLSKGVRCFEYSKSPAVFFTAGADRIIKLWNPYVLQKPAGSLIGHNSAVSNMVFDQDTSSLISIDEHFIVMVWNTRDLQLVQSIQDPQLSRLELPISCAYWHTESRSLVIGQDTLKYFKRFHKKKAEYVSTHSGPIVAVLYNKLFNLVVTSCAKTIQIFDIWNGKRIFQYNRLQDGGELTGLCFDTSEQRLISATKDGLLSVWNFNNGQELQRMRTSSRNCITQAIFMNDKSEKYIVSTGWDKKVSLFNDRPGVMGSGPVREFTGEFMGTFNGHNDDILCIDYLDKKSVFATGSSDGQIRIWSMVSGHVKGKFFLDNSENLASVEKLIFANSPLSTDFFPILTIHIDGTLRVWDWEAKKLLKTVTFDLNHALTAMAVNDEGNHMIVSDSIGNVRILDISRLYSYKTVGDFEITEIRNWRAHVDNITAVSYSDVSTFLMTASKDGSVRLWNETGDHVGIFNQEEPWELFQSATYAAFPKDLMAIWENTKEDNGKHDSVKDNIIMRFKKGVLGIDTTIIKLAEIDLKNILKSQIVPENLLRERVVARATANKWTTFVKTKQQRRLMTANVLVSKFDELEFFKPKNNFREKPYVDMTSCKYYSAYHHLPTHDIQAVESISKTKKVAGDPAKK